MTVPKLQPVEVRRCNMFTMNPPIALHSYQAAECITGATHSLVTLLAQKCSDARLRLRKSPQPLGIRLRQPAAATAI